MQRYYYMGRFKVSFSYPANRILSFQGDVLHYRPGFLLLHGCEKERDKNVIEQI